MLSESVKYIIDSVIDVIGFEHSTEQSGGEFIGKGTFGCVYRPAIDVLFEQDKTELMVTFQKSSNVRLVVQSIDWTT